MHAAWEDGVLTAEELREVTVVAGLLGLDPLELNGALEELRPPP